MAGETSVIELQREGKYPIVINPPTAPALRVLWDVALAKFEARTGARPATKADADVVGEEYRHLMAKPHSSLGHVIREICEKAPGGD